MMRALDIQSGGSHYKDCKIQPVEYIEANGLDYLQGNVIKYVTRHKTKGGEGDIDKAIHYLQLIKELQYRSKEIQYNAGAKRGDVESHPYGDVQACGKGLCESKRMLHGGGLVQQEHMDGVRTEGLPKMVNEFFETLSKLYQEESSERSKLDNLASRVVSRTNKFEDE